METGMEHAAPAASAAEVTAQAVLDARPHFTAQSIAAQTDFSAGDHDTYA